MFVILLNGSRHNRGILGRAGKIIYKTTLKFDSHVGKLPMPEKLF